MKLNSLKEFFDVLHDVSFPYVVLRNFDNLPDSVELGPHSDLDLLVYDIDHWIELFPEAKRVYPSPRVQFRQPIGDSFIQIDVRYVGDGYYPKWFEDKILKDKEKHKNGFFIPSKVDHLVALAYHVYHHRGGF